MDAGNRRLLHAHGNRADSEESSRRAGETPRARVHVQISEMGRGRARSVSTRIPVTPGEERSADQLVPTAVHSFAALRPLQHTALVETKRRMVARPADPDRD